MKTIEIKVTYKYEIEIDENNGIVQDYESENDLILDLASYRFSEVLPVMKEGVKVKDIELVEIS
jgi:hypothetical protein